MRLICEYNKRTKSKYFIDGYDRKQGFILSNDFFLVFLDFDLNEIAKVRRKNSSKCIYMSEIKKWISFDTLGNMSVFNNCLEEVKSIPAEKGVSYVEKIIQLSEETVLIQTRTRSDLSYLHKFLNINVLTGECKNIGELNNAMSLMSDPYKKGNQVFIPYTNLDFTQSDGVYVKSSRPKLAVVSKKCVITDELKEDAQFNDIMKEFPRDIFTDFKCHEISGSLHLAVFKMNVRENRDSRMGYSVYKDNNKLYSKYFEYNTTNLITRIQSLPIISVDEKYGLVYSYHNETIKVNNLLTNDVYTYPYPIENDERPTNIMHGQNGMELIVNLVDKVVKYKLSKDEKYLTRNERMSWDI